VCDASNVKDIEAEVKNRIPSSLLEDGSAGALTFKIPNEAMGELAGIVRKLEENVFVGVREWGIS
jgi:hypothetical protein